MWFTVDHFSIGWCALAVPCDTRQHMRAATYCSGVCFDSRNCRLFRRQIGCPTFGGVADHKHTLYWIIWCGIAWKKYSTILSYVSYCILRLKPLWKTWIWNDHRNSVTHVVFNIQSWISWSVWAFPFSTHISCCQEFDMSAECWMRYSPRISTGKIDDSSWSCPDTRLPTRCYGVPERVIHGTRREYCMIEQFETYDTLSGLFTRCMQNAIAVCSHMNGMYFFLISIIIGQLHLVVNFIWWSTLFGGYSKP